MAKKIISNLLNWVKKHGLLFVILILSLPAVRYLFIGGYFGVSDDLHIGWLYEMDRVVRMFQFPPRYVPDLSFGFGYPLFTFVYPFPFYIAEVFHLLGFSLVDSIKLVFGLSIPFSMYFMFKLLRVYVNNSFSLAGAVLYVYAPYRALEMFVRGTIGEIVAFVFFPLIIWSFIRMTPIKIINNEESKKWIGIAGLSTAALVLSHNIMAYMFMPFLLLFVLARIYFLVKDKTQIIKNCFMALSLGLLSSAYFWLPAINESRLMKYDTVFNFYDHFPALKQFVTPYWGYGASVPGNYDTMSFYMGITGIAVFLLGSVLFLINNKRFSKDEKVILGWGLIVILISVFMMNFRSALLWRSIPLLPYFQFPWRFIAMVTLLSPLFLIAMSKFKYVPIVVIVCAIGLNFNYFKTSEYLGRFDDYYIDRYIPVPNASEAYLKTSEEYLRLPKEAASRPDKNYPRAYTVNDSVKLEIDEINALDAKIKSVSESQFILNYSKYNYPGWTAKIDGETTKIIAGEPFGQISFLVPSGEHLIEVKYKELPTRVILGVISLVAVVTSLFFVLKKK